MSDTLARDLAALIGSRICHDLISPIGAISNGVELLTMSGASSGPEISLISDSVDNANARVKLFRIAFGMASPGQMTGRAEITAILTALTTPRLSYHWDVSEDCPREETKLACLLIMCLESALPRGGAIRVTRTEDQWTLRATSDRIAPTPELWARLTTASEATGLRPNDVHFLLAPLEARALSRKISSSQTKDTLTLTV